MKRYLLLLLLFMGLSLSTFAENKVAKVYVCGFAASFNDSTVYFTDVQTIDSAYINSKTHFLYSRENYSYQLHDYLQKQGAVTPTCITMFATNRKDIDKKVAKMRKRYSNGKYIVKDVKAPDFVYLAIKYEE